MSAIAINFLCVVAGFIAGIWCMAWAQRERERHERETERMARLAKKFEEMTRPAK